MIDDKIGSIGSTQGVNDSATPITKNAPTTSQKRPLFNTPSTPLPSNHEPALEVCATLPPTTASPAGSEVAPPSAAATCTRALPLPPNATRLTLAALVIGG